MTKLRLFLLLIFFAFCYSCGNSNATRRVIVGDLAAEGDISKDTIYNGLINFYDTSTGKLVQSINYQEGVEKGERKDYYSNGKVKLRLHYTDGKINGEVLLFDSAGNITESQNRYYDIRVGPSIEFKNKKVSQYYFYSLENNELIHINYDSIQGKRVEQLNDTSFFFWHLNEYITSETDKQQSDIFLYTPNPPQLNFLYAICIIDDKYGIKKVIKEFTPKESWGIYDLDYSLLKKGETYAIKLTVDNEFDSDDRIATMFKKL